MDIYIGEQLSEDDQVPSLKLLAEATILTQNVNWSGQLGSEIEEEIGYILKASQVTTDAFLR